MYRVTANAVADRPAETSASAYSCLHECRCYETLRNTAVGERARMTPDASAWLIGCASSGVRLKEEVDQLLNLVWAQLHLLEVAPGNG